MTIREAKKRKLLKPPELKPLFTIMLIFACIFHTDKTDYAFVNANSVRPDDVANAINRMNPAYLVKILQAATAELSLWVMMVNILFLWLFGTVVERKLPTWRIMVFTILALTVPYLLLGFDSLAGHKTMYVGPTLMTTFILGGFFVFKPKKDFSPQDWKPLPWKIFKGDENALEQVKPKFVDPNIYIGMFFFWTALQQFMFSISKADLIELCHGVAFVGNIHKFFVGTLSPPGSVLFISPLAGVGALAAGALSAYILFNVNTTRKPKRAVSDLQQQAMLQYRELRALDMNHAQAVEGTSRLIGVPLDVAREWIAQGLQPTKDEPKTDLNF